MKVIFFDIDGTLIDEETHIIPESAKEAIAKARANGHICMINTGRTKHLVIGPISEKIEFDGYVLGCGTQILLNGESVYHQVFSEETGRRIEDSLIKHRIDAVLEGEENIYQRPLEELFTKTFYDYMYRFKDRKVGSYEDAIGRFDKFFCYSETVEQIEAFCKEFEDELDCIDREHGFYEVIPKGCSKGSGIQKLAEHLQMSMENTVAIGDSNNDKDMMEMAHISIAMGNATQAIKEISDFVTTDVMSDGIENGLRWLGAIE